MPKKVLFLVICFALIGIFKAFAQEGSQPEEISITTYYPSPYGVYNEMQLYPHPKPVTDPCDSTAKGTMYYDSDDGQVKICDGAGNWPSIGGACSDVPGADQSNCWKDIDGDGYSSRTGDCDESCNTCYAGSLASTTGPDGKDQNCNGIIDDYAGPDVTRTCPGGMYPIPPGTTVGDCQQYCASLGKVYNSSNSSLVCCAEDIANGINFTTCSTYGNLSQSNAAAEYGPYTCRCGGMYR